MIITETVHSVNPIYPCFHIEKEVFYYAFSRKVIFYYMERPRFPYITGVSAFIERAA